MSLFNPNHKYPEWMVALCIVFPPLLLVLVPLAFLVSLVATVFLHLVIWSWWHLRGWEVLLVYSDRPLWHDYIEQHLLPRLGKRAVILNRSEHRRWPFSIAQLAFYYFGGLRQFNPLAVVFRPFHRSQVFRFWLSFADFEHGHPAALHQMEKDMFGACRANPLECPMAGA